MAAVIKENELSVPIAQRYPLYRAIHKGLRGLMLDTLSKLGTLDVEDPHEFQQAVEQIKSVLQIFKSHLEHENQFVHPALERATAGASSQTAGDHQDHEVAIAALYQQVHLLELVTAEERALTVHQLYLQFSIFVAENLEHMVVEETDNHAVLIAAYSDQELLAIKDAIVAHVPPAENMVLIKLMLAYMNNTERTELLRDVKNNAPPPVAQAIFELARNTLTQRDYFKVERSLAAR